VSHDALGEPTNLVCCAVQLFIFFVSSNQLSMLLKFSGDGVDDGVRRVQPDSSVGYLGCEVCHVVMYDDMGFAWTLVDMMGVVC
jgi:hypothetical protein